MAISRVVGLLAGSGLRAQLLRGGVGSGAVKVAGTSLSLAVALVLARVLGPGGYGIYSYVFALVTILTIPAQFGLPQLVIRETARAQSSDEWAALRGIWRWSGAIALVSSVVIALVGGLTAAVFSDRFDSLQLATFGWGLALVPALALARLRGAALRGLRHVVASQMPDTVLRPALFVIFVLATAFGVGAELTADRAMALHVVAAALAFGVGAVWLRRTAPAQARTVRPRFEHRKWAHAVMPLGLTAGMTLINRHADIVLLGFFVEADEVGMYRVAVQAAILVAFGLQTVNLVAAPHVTRMYHQGNYAQLQRLVTACARGSLAVALPATLVFVLLGEWLLRWVVGVEYIGAATALAILSFGQIANASMGLVGLLLNMTGHEGIVARTVALAASGNIVANLVLIPLLGMNGAAVATAVTFLVWNILLARAVKNRLSINSTAFPMPRIN